MPRQQIYQSTPESSGDIQTTSRQTRFYLTENDSKDLDLPGLDIQIGNSRQILSNTHLKLNAGVRYVLVGRNGVGKSTLLQVLGTRLIPGIPKNLSILYLQQNLERDEHIPLNGAQSVLQFVVESDRVRAEALRKKAGKI